MYAEDYFMAHHMGNSARILIVDDQGAYLAHHQRKGAHWGEMNGPPYPLDRQTVKEAYGSSAKPAKDAPKKRGISFEIGKDVKEIGTMKKSGMAVTINGKDASAIRENIQQKIKELSEKRRQAAVERAVAKEQKRKEEAEKKENERLAKEALEEAERKKQEELEKDKERAATEALKNYYREHPLQIMSARDVLSPEDLADVQNKIKLDRQLQDFRRDEILRYARTAKDVVDTLGTVVTGAENLKKLYNIGAETYNSLVAAQDPNDNKKPMKIIGRDTFKPKPPSDASTDKSKKNNSENQETHTAQKGSGNKNKSESFDEVMKDVADKAKASSKSKEADRVKKEYEDLKKDVTDSGRAGQKWGTPKGNSATSDKKTTAASSKPAYVEKVKLRDGTTRYFYDEDQYRGYKDAQNSGLTRRAARAYAVADKESRRRFDREMFEMRSSLSEYDYGRFVAIHDVTMDVLNAFIDPLRKDK